MNAEEQRLKENRDRLNKVVGFAATSKSTNIFKLLVIVFMRSAMLLDNPLLPMFLGKTIVV
jgi:hypothetical protein